MNSSTPGVAPLHQRMLDDMRMRKLEPKTRAGYIRAVRSLAAYLGRSPDTATIEELRRFQLHMVDRGSSPITLNDHRAEVLLRRHARPRRADGQDAAGARAANPAGGPEP